MLGSVQKCNGAGSSYRWYRSVAVMVMLVIVEVLLVIAMVVIIVVFN